MADVEEPLVVVEAVSVAGGQATGLLTERPVEIEVELVQLDLGLVPGSPERHRSPQIDPRATPVERPRLRGLVGDIDFKFDLGFGLGLGFYLDLDLGFRFGPRLGLPRAGDRQQRGKNDRLQHDPKQCKGETSPHPPGFRYRNSVLGRCVVQLRTVDQRRIVENQTEVSETGFGPTLPRDV